MTNLSLNAAATYIADSEVCSNETRKLYWDATHIGMHSAGTEIVLWCKLYCGI